MPDATILFAIDNTQDYPVIAQTQCQRILVQENYNSVTPPTADLLQKIPASAANAIAIPKGTTAIYTPVATLNGRNFNAGQVVGTIRTVSGSVTVQQIESQQV